MRTVLPSIIGLFLACAAAPASGTPREPSCVPAGRWLDPATGKVVADDALIGEMAERPVVLLGETHSNPRHHRWQLHVVAALHGRNPGMVLGFEAFPRRVQPSLDRWVDGELDEETFLDQVGWNEIWKFDPDLYLGLFRFARLHRVPMVALNVDKELVSRISRDGWRAVPRDAREGVGDPAPAGDAYLEILFGVFAEHLKEKAKRKDEEPRPADRDDPEFGNFVDAQLAWDRAMAEALAEARKGGDRTLAVGIVGQGHLAYGYGISRQLADLGIGASAVLLPWDAGRPCSELAPADGPAVADAVFGIGDDAAPAESPRLFLGVMIEDGDGGVLINQVIEGSVAEASELAAGDLIVEAAGSAISTSAELVAIIGRQAPGTWLPLRVRRGEKTVEAVAKFPALR